MKQFFTILSILVCMSTVSAQVSGNVNYQTQIRYPDQNISINYPANSNILMSVKGLANVKADQYVAIFSITQTGKTAKEVNELIDDRIQQALEPLLSSKVIDSSYIDMISFVPIYTYELEKKIFSKNTYNEVPDGFELKKNIHISYSNPNALNSVISSFSIAEIYDLVRVDYFSNDLERIKTELHEKAKTVLSEKMNSYSDLLNINLDSIEKHVSDAYRVVLPVEKYQSYQAYQNSLLKFKSSAKTKQVSKSTSLYYQPIMDKEFDFVMNPVILEPVIQVMYEIKLIVNREGLKKSEPKKEFLLISPNGDIKPLNTN